MHVQLGVVARRLERPAKLTFKSGETRGKESSGRGTHQGLKYLYRNKGHFQYITMKTKEITVSYVTS